MDISVNPYLYFDGKTEEAFVFYRSVFGGSFKELKRYKDLPPSEKILSPQEAKRILHIALPIGNNTVLMGSDTSQHMGQKLLQGNNVYVSLHTKSLGEAQKLYNGLSAGGKIEMPLEKMFWGAYYASFADKFGVNWMVNYQEKT